MPTIEYRNDVAVLHLGDGENRFSIDYMNSIHKCLDSLSPTASGLVTPGTGKFYSNGLSRGTLASHARALRHHARTDLHLGESDQTRSTTT